MEKAGGLFLLGFASIAFPCVLPLVPGYLSAVSAVEAQRLGDQPVPDLSLRVSSGDAVPDYALDLLCSRRARLIQRRLAHGAHDLAFEFGKRRVLLTRARCRGE